MRWKTMVPSFKYWHYIVGVVSRINPIRQSPDKTIPLPAQLTKYLLWGGSYFSQISEDVIYWSMPTYFYLVLCPLLAKIWKFCARIRSRQVVLENYITIFNKTRWWRQCVVCGGDTAALISNILMRRGEDWWSPLHFPTLYNTSAVLCWYLVTVESGSGHRQCQ